MQHVSSKSTGLTSCDSETCARAEPTTYRQLTLFAAGSHASRSLSPGSAAARAMTATSGRRCAALLKSCGPVGSLLRTLLASPAYISTRCYLTWKISATPAGRLRFRLVPSVRRTSDSACSLLPTPTAGEHTFNRNAAPGSTPRPTLMGMARYDLWPTPRSTDGSHGGRVTPCKSREGGNLIEAVSAAMWPTPTVGDSKAARNATAERQRIPPTGIHGGRTLTDYVTLYPTPTARDCYNRGPSEANRNSLALNHMATGGNGGVLNPTWVEWLMGFPTGWSDCDASETP